MDTPVINGTAYPYLVVEQRRYRFRILSIANDRYWNLGLYYAGNGAIGTAVDAVKAAKTKAKPGKNAKAVAIVADPAPGGGCDPNQKKAAEAGIRLLPPSSSPAAAALALPRWQQLEAGPLRPSRLPTPARAILRPPSSPSVVLW